MLDVGCGTGLVIKDLMPRMNLDRTTLERTALCGMDLSPLMLEKAGATYTSRVEHSIEDMPWPIDVNWADLIVCNGQPSPTAD